ncbi:hypothetical protein CS063_17205 [Sporanaerobium hydrogeniformans]|uniref:Uncharacterized protein n=1 Tax=Sporanaerobium hydrogeniformans TaxID=3072179 RepID=A0AC61D652_9FIRM|nr:hypothetical protein [Sporanaerobium hydrogeniformans]PHV69189.1 hypothetical protein CS063_17205 [Sporanaerobium hydrogeniformans]
MGRKSPHGFTTQAEYMKWYYQTNKEVISQKRKKYRQENREKMLESERAWYRANYKPKKRNPSTYTYKYVYKVKDDDVVEFLGVEKAAEQLFVCVHTIRNSVRLRRGYCKSLDCYLLISKDKLSKGLVLSKVRDNLAS